MVGGEGLASVYVYVEANHALSTLFKGVVLNEGIAEVCQAGELMVGTCDSQQLLCQGHCKP